MIYRTVNILVYIISVLLAMYGLQTFDFERFLRKGRISQFYVFYVVASVALGYLFAQFILNFGTLSFYWFKANIFWLIDLNNMNKMIK